MTLKRGEARIAELNSQFSNELFLKLIVNLRTINIKNPPKPVKIYAAIRVSKSKLCSNLGGMLGDLGFVQVAL